MSDNELAALEAERKSLQGRLSKQEAALAKAMAAAKEAAKATAKAVAAKEAAEGELETEKEDLERAKNAVAEAEAEVEKKRTEHDQLQAERLADLPEHQGQRERDGHALEHLQDVERIHAAIIVGVTQLEHH